MFSISYRPAPETDFLGQLEDTAAAFRWIREHRDDYPVAQDQVFLTGDSAGGTLALYMTAVERSSEFAEKIGIGQSGLSVAGSALISPLTDLTSYLALCGFDAKCEFGDARLVPIIDCITPRKPANPLTQQTLSF